MANNQQLPKNYPQPQVKLVRGDLTKQRVDIIVNAANTLLFGGGGVEGVALPATVSVVRFDAENYASYQRLLA